MKGNLRRKNKKGTKLEALGQGLPLQCEQRWLQEHLFCPSGAAAGADDEATDFPRGLRGKTKIPTGLYV